MQQKLISFFEARLGVDPGQIAAETPLYSSGLLDSFGMVEVIMFVEQESGVRFNPEDISLENLDSVERILRFVETAGAAR
ncbi:MAG TPA: acyl carrier protein [Longimicrobium sp.]|nr:acyl carrier protein [Longimicrobium sp.]